MQKTKGAWRGVAAVALALVYALAVEDLMDWLGPVRFALVSAGVVAALWLLGTAAPHNVHYVAPPTVPVDESERVGATDIMLLIAAVIVLVAVCIAVVPSLAL